MVGKKEAHLEAAIYNVVLYILLLLCGDAFMLLLKKYICKMIISDLNGPSFFFFYVKLFLG